MYSRKDIPDFASSSLVTTLGATLAALPELAGIRESLLSSTYRRARSRVSSSILGFGPSTIPPFS
jgi:hypothetical protein